jgi:hypothetical protein
MPYEVYARETRRIDGRAIFTEHDAHLAQGLKRAPLHADSISITEWFLDSHACTPRAVPGSEEEGMVMLKNQTVPGQVPLGTLFPRGLNNLVVPVCLSATHVGWGAIRLEPTWMSIAEAAAHAIAMAKRQGVAPSAVDADPLVRLLAERRVLLTFFNDIEGKEAADWYPAVQYLGTQGYFATYDARPDDNLTSTLADAWIDCFARGRRGERVDPNAEARTNGAAEQKAGDPVTAAEFARRLDALAGTPKGPSSQALLAQLNIPADHPITRANACRILFDAGKRTMR